MIECVSMDWKWFNLDPHEIRTKKDPPGAEILRVGKVRVGYPNFPHPIFFSNILTKCAPATDINYCEN